MSPKPKGHRKNNSNNGGSSKIVGVKKAVNIRPHDEEKEFVHVSHRSFVKNLRIAQETAFKKKKPVEITWRGYKTIVEPTTAPFTRLNLRCHLLLALREIRKKKETTSQRANGKYKFYKKNVIYVFLIDFLKYFRLSKNCRKNTMMVCFLRKETKWLVMLRETGLHHHQRGEKRAKIVRK